MKKSAEALKWIITILKKHKVKFQISGGLAAKAYGSKRKLTDIDIDLAEKDFEKILPDVKDFVVYGPRRYKSSGWDLLLTTLSYKGQDIDIGGAYNTKTFDKNKKKWVGLKANFQNAAKKRVFGVLVPVISKKDLVSYKKKLSRKVDLIDINSIGK